MHTARTAVTVNGNVAVLLARDAENSSPF